MQITEKLKAAIEGAVHGIKEYNGTGFKWEDGWCAAEDVLAALITRCLFEEDGYPQFCVDGRILAEIRDELIDGNLPDGHP